jgi:CheY-like chemotaxis protein
MQFGGNWMSAKVKLLIVDDESAMRTLLSQIFEEMGHSVRMAQDGFSALQQIRETMPDVLLSDLNMPGMSGFELLSVVRRRFPGIYVIATSGAYSGEDVPYGIAADAFYEKATKFRSLLGLMEAATAVDRLCRRDSNTSAPVWLSPVDGEPLCDAYVMITCPECMRAFSHAVEDSLLLIHETDCDYCQASIRYAVVQQLDPLLSQPYHPMLVEALSPLITTDLDRQGVAGVAPRGRMVA